MCDCVYDCLCRDYTEAGPWQLRFYVPYDPAGLAALYANSSLDLCTVLQGAQTVATPADPMAIDHPRLTYIMPGCRF